MFDLNVIRDGRCSLHSAHTEVRGIDKLGQKFVLELLTEEGSMLYLPKRGCRFIPRLRHRAKTEFDIVVAFAASYHKIRRNLRSEASKHTPSDERLAVAYLTQITIYPGPVLVLELVIRNVAGDVTQIETPPINL